MSHWKAGAVPWGFTGTEKHLGVPRWMPKGDSVLADGVSVWDSKERSRLERWIPGETGGWAGFLGVRVSREKQGPQKSGAGGGSEVTSKGNEVKQKC